LTKFIPDTSQQFNAFTIDKELNAQPLFGAPIQVRSFQSDAYLFSFNGKEKINEINGSGNDFDFGARIYDSRLARWLSIDPHSSRYPNESNYSFISNSPMVFVDIEGNDKIIYLKVINKDGTELIVATKRIINKNIKPVYNGWVGDWLTGDGYAYWVDTKVVITVDLRDNSTTISDEMIDWSTHYTFSEGINKKMYDDSPNDITTGEQGGGWTFT
jgi:RHS repeat-associated protein